MLFKREIDSPSVTQRQMPLPSSATRIAHNAVLKRRHALTDGAVLPQSVSPGGKRLVRGEEFLRERGGEQARENPAARRRASSGR